MVLGWGKVEDMGGLEGHDGNGAGQVRF